MVSHSGSKPQHPLRLALGCCCAAALLLVLGCGHKQIVRLPPPTPAIEGAVEVGTASWYGHPYHGRRTSSGEIYDMDQMTAAHLSLPFGTRVRVTNLTNNESTEVRITDRGPFIGGRIIDLSRAAARQISMIGPGTARVRVEVVAAPRANQRVAAPAVPPSSPPSAPGVVEVAFAPPIPPQADGEAVGCAADPYFGVQVGAFEDVERAMRMQGRMMDQFGSAEIVPMIRGEGRLYRVVVGKEKDSERVNALLRRIQRNDVDGFVTRVEGDEALSCL